MFRMMLSLALRVASVFGRESDKFGECLKAQFLCSEPSLLHRKQKVTNTVTAQKRFWAEVPDRNGNSLNESTVWSS